MTIRRGLTAYSRFAGLVFVAAVLCLPGPTLVARSNAAAADANTTVTEDASVLELAFGAASCAVRSGAVSNPRTLTVIDYSKPSTEQRLFVFDLPSRYLEYAELVAHGSGSGDNVATRFSNQPDTHESSLGLFVAEDTYFGKNGYSLRLNGLDRGFNDRALERGIVIHAAPYVGPDVVKTQGRLGRSWGCPALRPGIAKQVIDLVKGGGLVFAYYPDPQWLKSSKYLGTCAAAQPTAPPTGR